MKKIDYEKYLNVDDFNEHLDNPHCEHFFNLSRPENIEFALKILRTYEALEMLRAYKTHLIKKLAAR